MKFALRLLIVLGISIQLAVAADSRQIIRAVGIPLADHYAGIVAYEKYRNQMQYADYRLQLLPGPDLVRAYFQSNPQVDLAFNVAPMVMAMFARNPNFRWVSLIHRDGNALVINAVLAESLGLAADKAERKPEDKLASALNAYSKTHSEPVQIAITSPLSTHAMVLYKYLKDHDLCMEFGARSGCAVTAAIVKPPYASSFLRRRTARALPSAFEQSLPWPEIAEQSDHGHIAWYSKDVMQHEKGHVECIIIAKDKTIRDKTEALREVIYYIHRAGQDIESARREGGAALDAIIDMIRYHIPAHTPEAIIESLRPDLDVINYRNLNVDGNARDSFNEIMALAVEAGVLRRPIDVNALADAQFSTELTGK